MTDENNRQIMAAIRALAAGKKTVDELTLSTSEKVTVCLACELPLPSFCKDEQDAWERLNQSQRRTVASVNPKFQERKWAEIPVYFA